MDKSNRVTAEAVKKSYHFYAPIYDFVFGASLEHGRKALANEVTKIKPEKLLEVGVGTGILLGQYPTCTHVTGIDISEDMLSVAKKRAETLKDMRIELETMDAENLQYPDQSFDCVTVPYVLSVTPNPEQLIAEVKRVCKENGDILIVNHFSGSGFWSYLEKAFKNFADKIGFRSEFSYEEHIERNNLQIEKVISVNLFSLSKLILIKNRNQ